jgi:hypothetical protein
MSDRIGGRAGGPADIAPPAPEDTPTKAPSSKAAGETAAPKEAGVKDAFERQGQSQVNQALQTRLQGVSPKTMAQVQKLQFTSDDLAYLAQTFSALVAQNPGLNRLKRARMFARAILKRSRIRHMFQGISEPEMEQMCDAIGDVLEGSPVFGQLVDNLSEGTGKLNG